MTATAAPPLVLTRWACDCGRFIAESSIQERDYRDDSYYYGVRTESRFTCSRCGVVQHAPQLVAIGRATA